MQFLHSCVDDLVNQRPISYNNFSNDIEWTKEDYLISLKTIQNLYQKAAYQDEKYIENEIKDLNDSNKQKLIIKCFNVRKNEIIEKLLQFKHSENGPLMLDYSWRLKLVMGSAKLTNFVEPLFQLDLRTMENKIDEISFNNVTMEMNNNMLTKLIQCLEEIKN